MYENLHYLILLIYVGALFFVVFAARRSSGKEEFLLADRDLNVLQSASSIGASWFGAGVMISYTALAYKFGAAALWFFVGNVIGFTVFYRFARALRILSERHGFFTLPDYFRHKFGSTVGSIMGGLVVLITTGWLIINFMGGGAAVQAYSGISMLWSVVIAGGIIWLYSVIGGFRAIVYTDVIQSATMMVLFFLLIYILSHYGSSLSWDDFRLLDIPPFEILSFLLAGILVPLGSAELWQRVYACQSLEVLKKSIVWVCIFFLIVGIVLMLIGIVIRQQIPGLEPNEVLTEGFAALLSPAWSAVGIVVLYAAVMSSADSYLFAAMSSLTLDIFGSRGRLLPVSVGLSRLFLSIVAVFSIVAALFIGDILAITFLMTSGLLGLGFLVLCIWMLRIRGRVVVLTATIFLLVGIMLGAIVSGMSMTLIFYALGGVLLGLGIGKIAGSFKILPYHKMKV